MGLTEAILMAARSALKFFSSLKQFANTRTLKQKKGAVIIYFFRLLTAHKQKDFLFCHLKKEKFVKSNQMPGLNEQTQH